MDIFPPQVAARTASSAIAQQSTPTAIPPLPVVYLNGGNFVSTDSAKITTSGNYAYGIYANNPNSFSLYGTVIAKGNSTIGVYINGNTGSITKMLYANITACGSNGYALYVSNGANVSSAGKLTTYGGSGYGVYATYNNTQVFVSANVIAYGSNSFCLYANSSAVIYYAIESLAAIGSCSTLTNTENGGKIIGPKGDIYLTINGTYGFDNTAEEILYMSTIHMEAALQTILISRCYHPDALLRLTVATSTIVLSALL